MPSTAVPQDVRFSREIHAFGQAAGPGTEVVPLGPCLGVDNLPDPQQGKDPTWCLIDGVYVQVGSTATAPSGLPQFTMTPWVQGAVNWLERIKVANCPVNLFFVSAPCGSPAVFDNRRRSWVYRNAIITDHAIANPMQRDADGPIDQAFSITTDLGRLDHWLLTISRIATTETAAINSITAEDGQCAGDCGPYRADDKDLWMSADTVAAAVPDLIWSDDSAATFTSPATGFAAGESVMATLVIKPNSTTTRTVSVRDGDAAAPLEVQYSDDDAATETLVVVGATNNEAAVGAQSLCKFGDENLWLCTDDGRVFYSSDYAESWTDQTTALAASGASALNAIHFCNANIGYAVGAGDTVIYTLDGGTNWSAGTATGSGDGLNTVHCFDANRVIVGTDNAVSTKCVYMTFDQTATWETKDEGLAALTTDTCGRIRFMSDGMTGYLAKDTVVPLGTVYKSIDGGDSWKDITTPLNAGLNDICIIHANLAYIVGEAQGGTSFIARVAG
ncbi:MAG: hypothetical protein GY832_25930 [Chloroflexi bacterium]|nr:hypothetical protein [Chloroflexota bacterium]